MSDQLSNQPKREEKEQKEPTHNAPRTLSTQPHFRYPGNDLGYGQQGPIHPDACSRLDLADLICSEHTIADLLGGPPAPARAEGADPIAVHNATVKLMNIGVKAMDQKLEPLRNYRTGRVALFPRDGNAITMLNDFEWEHLLAAFGLPADGTREAYQQRFCHHIGAYNLATLLAGS